jgi:hypothetical protein
LNDNGSKPFQGCLNPEQAYPAGKTPDRLRSQLPQSEAIAAVGRTPVGQTQTGVPTSQSGERPRPKTVHSQDLTEDQRALLKDFEKNGIHLTPEQILKIAGGEIKHHPVPPSFDEEIAAIHIDLEKRDGSRLPAIEARRIEVGLARKNKPNLDFATIWSQKDMSASLSLAKGYISLAGHGDRRPNI